jgi:hypothetical protein
MSTEFDILAFLKTVAENAAGDLMLLGDSLPADMAGRFGWPPE